MSIEVFDLEGIKNGARGYSSVVSDGNYLYLIPLNNDSFFGEVARFDLKKDFCDPGSWSFFDTQALDPRSGGYIGALFDGRCLYLIPHCNRDFHGVVARYDTTSAFTDPSSWDFQDTQQFNGGSRGFVSGAFDGKYLYFAPYRTALDDYSGLVTRYDVAGGFSEPGSWEFFDVSELGSSLRGFHGAIFHKGFIIFVPYAREDRTFHGNLVRYQTSGLFADSDSWSFIDLEGINPRARGFVGGTSLGGSIYLAPYFDGRDRSGLVAIGHAFSGGDVANSDWHFVDAEVFHPQSRGFFGAIAVGEAVYFIPHCLDGEVYHGLLTKMDSEIDSISSRAWSFRDIREIDRLTGGFMGGVFAEGWIYLAPFENSPGSRHGRVARVQPW